MKIHSVNRPWGDFERFTLNEKSTVKIIAVRGGKRLSLQYHRKRKEFWRILEGRARATVGNKTFAVNVGDSVAVPMNTKHRIEALAGGVRFLEISFGTFDEKDEVRVEDDFGRAK
jgi:mannose-6-phosphate isomerase